MDARRTAARDAPGPMVSTNYARNVHRALLLACGVDGARQFWLENPLVLDGYTFEPGAMARYVEDSSAPCPMEFVGRIMTSLELFLLERGIPLEEFCEGLLTYANGGSHVPGKTILELAVPNLAALFRIRDPHQMFLQMCAYACPRFYPDLIFGIVGWRLRSSLEKAAHVAIGFRALWEGTLNAWDASVFTLELLRRMPRSLGLEPFGPATMVCDARAVEDAAGAATVTTDPARQVVYIDGERVGHGSSFAYFCQTQGLELEHLGIPPTDVVVAERDWTCPVRRRVVLHAGCAYAAPLYVFCLHWRVGAPPAQGAFHHVVADAINGAKPPDEARARALMTEFLGSCVAPISCRYGANEQTLYVGERPVVRGVPAIILRNCLRTYLRSGRREFAFREFKADSEIISHPKNTGFEVRLRRLRESLHAAACGIWIEPTRRGHFTLKVYGEVSFEDEGFAN